MNNRTSWGTLGVIVKIIGILAIAMFAIGCPVETDGPGDGDGNGNGNGNGSGPAAPAIPTGIMATSGNAQIILTWDSSAGATTYDIFRGVGSDSALEEAPIASIAADSRATIEYIDNDVTIGATYRYAVVATNEIGSSGQSAIVEATVTRAPVIPTGVIAAPGATQVILTWDSSAGATAYNIFRGVGVDSALATEPIASIAADSQATAEYIDNDVTIGETYRYAVVATNDAGQSEQSVIVEATVTGVPAIPTRVMATTEGTRVTLTWNSSSESITYEIFRGVGVGSALATEPIASIAAGSRATIEYIDPNVTIGETYRYAVVATNERGSSEQSAIVDATVIGEPAIPTGITATIEGARVILTWNSSARATAYNIFRGVGVDSALEEVPIASIAAGSRAIIEYIDDDVTIGETYRYAVAATNERGSSEQSAIVDAAIFVAPAIPTGVLATDSGMQIILTWNSSAGSTTYNIFRGAGSGSALATEPIASIAAGSRAIVEYTDTNVIISQTYRYAVVAINEFGSSGQSAIVDAAVRNVDRDDDGLIEINTLDDLFNIRYNLQGTSYKQSADDSGNNGGCPASGCFGYELTRNLDFADFESYTGGNVNAEWRPNNSAPESSTNAGWTPIGICLADAASGLVDDLCRNADDEPFAATFEGNGYTIVGLYVRGSGAVGLFGATSATAKIRNLGLIEGNVYGGDDDDSVGALVGWNDGLIMASYANAIVRGGGRSDKVGGLVGWNEDGTIIASHAAGDVYGGLGNEDAVGGLVGYKNRGAIIAGRSTGNVNGGDGDFDRVGGLVGYSSLGTIIASYATGNAYGSDGIIDSAGALVGDALLVGNAFTEIIVASYGFGSAIGETRNAFGEPPSGVTLASGLTAENAGTPWNYTTHNTLGVWDFGDQSQLPALRYADYDGSRANYSCDDFPETLPDNSPIICGVTRIPGQLEATVPIVDDSNDILGFADVDRNGLIEINTLDALNNMRYNLAGTSYKTAEDDRGNDFGCPDTGCFGYELTKNLDFADAASYLLENINTDWRPNDADPNNASNRGWQPIGFCDDRIGGGCLDSDDQLFAATFEGRGYTITGLYSRGARGNLGTGLFGVVGEDAVIRNVGLLGGAVYGDDGDDSVGMLAGYNVGGTIIASYSTGSAYGEGGIDVVGALVGDNRGRIMVSYATGSANGGAGNEDTVGGLVGVNRGNIVATYATGSASGDAGNKDDVGGLVGYNYAGGEITASYATVNVSGGSGDRIRDQQSGRKRLSQRGGLTDRGTYRFPGGIFETYGFGPIMSGVSNDLINGLGAPPTGVGVAAELTADNVGSLWNDADSDTLDAWDFGTNMQAPALRYADYDGMDGDDYDDCDMFPETLPDGSALTCGTTLIPGQGR